MSCGPNIGRRVGIDTIFVCFGVFGSVRYRCIAGWLSFI